MAKEKVQKTNAMRLLDSAGIDYSMASYDYDESDLSGVHAAAALGRPVFGFYGPTDPALTGPWGGNATVFTAGCRCTGCLKRICPDGGYRCWALDAETVAAAIMEKLEGAK